MSVSAASLLLLLDSPTDGNGRRAAIRMALDALRQFPALHVRPLYGSLMRAIGAEATVVPNDAFESDWQPFCDAINGVDTLVLRNTDSLTWDSRTFVIKQFAHVFPASSHAAKPFNALLTALTNVADSHVDDAASSNFARSHQEIRAANEIIRQLISEHLFTMISVEDSPSLTAAFAAVSKNLSGSSDLDVLERVAAVSLFDAASLKIKIDVDGILPRLKADNAAGSRHGQHMIVYAGGAIAEASALLEESTGDDVAVEGQASSSAHTILNIAAFICDFRPKVVTKNGDLQFDVIKGISRIVRGIVAAFSHANARQDTETARAALHCAARFFGAVIPHSASEEHALELRRLLVEALQAFIPVAVPDDASVWKAVLDFAAVNAVLECVVQAANVVSVLRLEGDDATPLLRPENLSAIAVLAAEALGTLAPLLNAAFAHGKRGRDRRAPPKKDESTVEIERYAAVLNSVKLRSETLAKFATENPSRTTFRMAEVRCGQVSW